MATPQTTQTNPATGDKGVCNFMWGPGCTNTILDPSCHGNHKCGLPKGHTEDCWCFMDNTRTKLGNLYRSRV